VKVAPLSVDFQIGSFPGAFRRVDRRSATEIPMASR
jgi:hypothetical protein